jgi:flavodoxin
MIFNHFFVFKIEEVFVRIKVLYHTVTGNTKKVANAIAEVAGVNAEKIVSMKTVDFADLLFIGDGLYAGKIGKETDVFIKTLNTKNVKKVAVFSTYGGQNRVGDIFKKALTEQGLSVCEETYSCKGKAWFFFNRKHPSEAELKAAKEFAERIIKGEK